MANDRIIMKTKGFTLIATLLMLLLLSGIAIGLMMMVNTEGKVGGTDLQNDVAYHAAEGGIEKMYTDLAAVFKSAQAPTAAQICGIGAAAYEPSMVGVTWTQYSVMPGSIQQSSCPATLTTNWGIVQSGPNVGLYAQIIPVNMLVTASLLGGQEVSMTRQAQVALVPVFQFGMFCEGDCSIFPGSSMTFAGPVHANGDFYPFVNTGATLTFQGKIAAFGNIVRTVLPNTNPSAKDGTVWVPTANNTNACSTTTTNCTSMASVTSGSPSYGDGSVTGMGSTTAQPTANIASGWANWSNKTTNDQVINGNYYVTGDSTPPGTGAKKLSLPFVGGGAQPYEIIRRPAAGESATSLLGSSREYNMAQIHVLLDDDPANLPGGASDVNNVRLANVAQTTGNTLVTPRGVPIAAANYNASFGTPPAGDTFNLYFASASNAFPNVCAGLTCTPDWPYAPAAFLGESTVVPTQGLQPAGAPVYLSNGAAPTISVCPPSTPAPAPASIPVGCPSAGGVYPYYSLPNPALPVVSSALTPYNAANSNAWNLIDGYLRVEYLNNSNQWVAVTNEWLQLGFARGVTAPNAANPNPINPNAILLLQEPADRYTNTANGSALGPEPTPPAVAGGNWAISTATGPTCSVKNGSGQCTSWSGVVVPQLVADSGVLGGQWAFGATPAAPTATTPVSLTQYNWYPINFYDAREGEPRDTSWAGTIAGDNSCTTNGVMNAVEIDVGNLQNWLAGTIGTSGKSVNYTAQNGYILYFSDRRGMLLNPNPTSVYPANTKTGDSGLEDTVNSTSLVGTPDGVLEPKMATGTFSPEDANENKADDNWGTQNLGLGFTGTVALATQPLNAKIISTNPAPNPYGTVAANGGDRIASCSTTGRKNWVSGARHVLKLVDGSLGNIPLMPVPVVYNSVNYYGGFTVASENPVYIQGDYNSNAADTTWANPPVDEAGMAAAAVIADAVSILSNNWDDRRSMVGGATDTSPTTLANRPSSTTYYRVAIAGGKNMTFTYPTKWAAAATEDDIGTDGGTHNFLRLLEDWGVGGVTENYKGSLASLYYATYNTGFYKCCNIVYGVPTRNFYFDLDFSVPAGLPPGTPMFRDVESMGYRQMFAKRLAGQ